MNRGEQSSIGRQIKITVMVPTKFELTLISPTTKDLLKTKQAKDSGRRSGAAFEYHVHEGKFNTKLTSMLQHKTHVHDGDLQESYALHSLKIHLLPLLPLLPETFQRKLLQLKF